MRNLPVNRPKGLSRQGLRVWALLIIAIGAAGQSIVRNNLLAKSPDDLTLMTIAVVMQIIMPCAIPLFTFLLVDGYQRTTSLKNYILRVAGVAVLSEIPYNLAMSGKWIDLSSRNPVFGMLVGMVMMFIFSYYCGKSMKTFLIRALVVIMAIFWMFMLTVNDGVSIVCMVSVLWFLRKNRNWQVYGGAIAMILCGSLQGVAILYLLSPIVFLVVHFYNDEIGEENKWINYLAYPVILLAIGLVGKYAI